MKSIILNCVYNIDITMLIGVILLELGWINSILWYGFGTLSAMIYQFLVYNRIPRESKKIISIITNDLSTANSVRDKAISHWEGQGYKLKSSTIRREYLLFGNYVSKTTLIK